MTGRYRGWTLRGLHLICATPEKITSVEKFENVGFIIIFFKYVKTSGGGGKVVEGAFVVGIDKSLR